MNFWRSSKSGFRVAKTPKSLPSASGGGAIEVRYFSDSPLQRGSGVSPLVKNGIFRFPTSAEDGASPFQPQPRNTSHEDKVEGKGEVEEGRDGHRGPVARHGAVVKCPECGATFRVGKALVQTKGEAASRRLFKMEVPLPTSGEDAASPLRNTRKRKETK